MPRTAAAASVSGVFFALVSWLIPIGVVIILGRGDRNDHPRPFNIWTKDAVEILASIQRTKANNEFIYTSLARPLT